MAARETSPDPTPAGIVMLIWYRPAEIRPAKEGVTLTPFTSIWTRATTGAAPENDLPAGTTGVVAPRPTPKSSTMSPGFAATVAKPRDEPVGPRMSYVPPPYAPEPSKRRMNPATCLLSRRQNDGPTAPRVTVEEAVPLDVVTTTATGPTVVSSGACRLICPGLTYHQ